MAKFLYIRPTKLHPEREQRAAVNGVTFDEEYVDEKPKRGPPGWFWREKVIHACRLGSEDEIHVSHASVIADNSTAALEKLAEITARGAVLVVASTGKRYAWHPDAAKGMELAVEMEREARRLVAKIAGDTFARNQAAKRERVAKRMREVRKMWLDPSISTEKVVDFSGLSRNALYKRFGARGTMLFGKVTP